MQWLLSLTPGVLQNIIAAPIVAILTIILMRLWYRRRWLLWRPHIDQANKKRPVPHKGLILMVSQHTACRHAIQYHMPELQYVWLLCSKDTEKLAQKIQSEFPKLCHAKPIIINDIYDPNEYRAIIDKIYNERPAELHETDIIADFNGMTSSGSVGMVLACLSDQRPLEYTRPKFDQDRKIAGTLDPLEIQLTWEMVQPVPAQKRPRSRREKTNASDDAANAAADT